MDDRGCTHPHNARNTNRVRTVDEITPPITTVARGRSTSDPVPVASALGTTPRAATHAVISTGRRRSAAPRRAASCSVCPCWRSLFISAGAYLTADYIMQDAERGCLDQEGAEQDVNGRSAVAKADAL